MEGQAASVSHIQQCPSRRKTTNTNADVRLLRVVKKAWADSPKAHFRVEGLSSRGKISQRLANVKRT